MNIVNFKKTIYDGNKISDILLKLGCGHIKVEQGGKIFTASLPNGNNHRSVQVKNNTYLDACIRSKGLMGIDIFDIVSYIKFGELTVQDMQYSRSMAINWVKRVLDIDIKEFTESPLEWAKNDIKKTNKPLDDKILNRYIDKPNQLWINEGISYETQKFFNIKYNLNNNYSQIVIPIYNKENKLIGVKARNLDMDEFSEKYIYLYPCNASTNLYGLNIAKKNIDKKKSIILFESEKSVMKAFQYGYDNSVALGCKDLTQSQLSLIKEYINDDTIIYLAFDKDVYFKDNKFVYLHLKGISNMFENNNVMALMDCNNLLDKKDSPIDKGENIFIELLDNAIDIKELNKKKGGKL